MLLQTRLAQSSDRLGEVIASKEVMDAAGQMCSFSSQEGPAILLACTAARKHGGEGQGQALCCSEHPVGDHLVLRSPEVC